MCVCVCVCVCVWECVCGWLWPWKFLFVFSFFFWLFLATLDALFLLHLLALHMQMCPDPLLTQAVFLFVYTHRQSSPFRCPSLCGLFCSFLIWMLLNLIDFYSSLCIIIYTNFMLSYPFSLSRFCLFAVVCGVWCLLSPFFAPNLQSVRRWSLPANWCKCAAQLQDLKKPFDFPCLHLSENSLMGWGFSLFDLLPYKFLVYLLIQLISLLSQL